MLCLSLFFTGPQYVEYEDIYPDELLDLFGIPQGSVASSTILKNHQPVFYNSCPETHSIQHRQSLNFYLQPFASDLVFSVSLRC